MTESPRSYIVTYCTSTGAEHHASVRAYNLLEAFQTVAVQLSAIGIKDVKLTNGVPDEAAIKAETEALRADAAASFVAKLLDRTNRG